MVVDDLLVTKRSVVHCPPYLCLISTDYKAYVLYLTYSLEVSWGYYGLIICIVGVYVPIVSSFPKSKNMVAQNREFPFMKHHNLPSYLSKGHLKVNEIT